MTQSNFTPYGEDSDFNLSLNFGDQDLDLDDSEDDSVLSESVSTRVRPKAIALPPAKRTTRPGLFDKKQITTKEETKDFKKKYEFKSFVEGEDVLTKVITQKQREKSSQSRTNHIDNAKVLDLDILMSAPKGYFKKYEKDVKRGVEYCRLKIAEEEKAEIISDASNNPTDLTYQNKAYLYINRHIGDFIRSQTDNRGAHAVIVTNMIVNEILGFDIIDPLWNDTRITEIVCNGAFDIQVEIEGEMYKVESASFRNREHLSTLLERLFRSVGKTLAQATPQVKGRLHDKSRIFAVHESIAPEGPNFNIRRHPEGFWTPEALISRGASSDEMMEYLGNLIHKGASFIIAGGTSTGKMLTLDTKVRTPHGYTCLQDVNIGDSILDHNGDTGTIVDIFKHEPQQVYALKTSNNQIVHCGLEHNWFVKEKRENNYYVLTTAEIIENMNMGKKYVVPFLGLPVEYDNEVKELPQRVDNDFFYLEKENKAISESFLYSSVHVRGLYALGLLRGSRKYRNSPHSLSFRTSSLNLAQSFIELVSSLGIIADFKEKGDMFEVVLDEDVFSVFSRYAQKVDKEKTLTIEEISAIDQRVEEMWCITVDTVDNTYMVGDSFITTHNTSMLNALTGFYPEHSRILTLEDNLEMKPNPKKLIAAPMETKPPAPDNVNDSGVTMRSLVHSAMQMRPDVLIIGEVTDAAAYDLCQALNTGHAGASTFHANSSQLAITRVASLVAQSGLTTIDGAFDLISAAFDFVINLRHFPQDGSRRIYSIDEVGSEVEIVDGKPFLRTKQLWKFNTERIENNKVIGHWEQVGDISEERAERRMFDAQRTLSWEELKELSSLPEGHKTA